MTQQYIIYAQGPDHDDMMPFEVKSGRRVIMDSFAEKYSLSMAQGTINILKFNRPDWTFEARETQ